VAVGHLHTLDRAQRLDPVELARDLVHSIRERRVSRRRSVGAADGKKECASGRDRSSQS
jgi:hypothetical protein